MKVSKDIKKENLNSLSTIQKILILQNLLKEMTSIKERFIDNKNKMLQKLDSNCYTYFKNKIYMKEIFDYCMSHKPEEHKDYQLIEEPKNYLKGMYQPLYDFFFHMRNENALMLKIIELSDSLTYEDLSDFFVNFLYGNIIQSSFVDEELIVMIYLLLEKLILKTLPEKIEVNKNIPISFFNDNFISYVFRALTRKIDLRNFLCNILNDFILRMESFSLSLSVDINIVNRFLKVRDRKIHSFMKNVGSLKEEEVRKIRKNFKKMNNNEQLFKKKTAGNMYLKRAKKIVLGKSVLGDNNSNNNNNNLGSLMTLEQRLTMAYSLPYDNSLHKPQLSQEINDKDVECKKFEKRKTQKSNDVKSDIKNDNDNDKIKNINQTINCNLILNKNKSEGKPEDMKKDSNINIHKSHRVNREVDNDLDENGQVKINIFFEDNSITMKKLKEILSKLGENKDNKYTISLAMKEYLSILINQILTGETTEIKNKNKSKNKNTIDINDKEIFSNSLIIEELKSIRSIKQDDSFRGLMRKIRFNHRIITRIIMEIINKLKDNLMSSPHSLKCITKIIDTLLNQRYTYRAKNKLSYYQLFMFQINFLIGNIILPILKNPEFNGVVTTSVISDMTGDNLKIISSIFDKMVTGHLFDKRDDPYMTIFNKFIIDTMPQLFELVENIEKNFELPNIIKNLISTNKNNDNEQRNLNYNFFKENKNENMNYQSICFSWKNVYILLQIISKYKKDLIDENKNIEQMEILKKFLNNKNAYINLFTDSIKNKKYEYFYITKVFYQESFYKKLISLTLDNYVGIVPKPNNDLITAFKKSIVEVLNYANIIQKESFYELTENMEEKTFKPKKAKKKEEEEKKINPKIKPYFKQLNKMLKPAIFNVLKNSLVKIDLADKDDDADFKKILFPQIRNNINFEMNYNIDNDIAQRIIFCTNYIHLYMRDIPSKYKMNNYRLLFDELIKETKNNIEFLKKNVLFEYYKKIKEVEKLNMMNSFFNSQIQNLEKLKCIEYLYNKLLLPIKLKIQKDPRDIISNIEYIKEQIDINNNLDDRNIDMSVMDFLKSRNQPIINMIDEFPDFHEYEDEYDNILDIEEKANTAEAINDYFSVMANLIKKEKIIKRFNKDELENIIYDLENYILTKMYDKLFPFESTKGDVFFYKKCKRLGFIRPENVVSDKKIINENLWDQAIQFIDNIEDKLTPVDKIKSIAKAFEIVQNSINFSSGKDELGVDDMIKPLIYIIIKSKPKNICSNYQYCELYLNSELAKKQYGVILSQIGLVIECIKRMKYDDLIGVSEEKFGKDEEIENNDEKENE